MENWRLFTHVLYTCIHVGCIVNLHVSHPPLPPTSPLITSPPPSHLSPHHIPPSLPPLPSSHPSLPPLPSLQLESGQPGPGSLAFPPGDEEGFDWMHPNQRRRAVSPDVVPNLFRPRKESLVDVNFDHDRAASGEWVTVSCVVACLSVWRHQFAEQCTILL